MADFEEKLSAILGDPQAMGQILSIAKSLTGDEADTPQPAQDTPTSADTPDLSGLVGLLSTSTQGDSALSALGDIDPTMIQLALTLFSEYNTTDNRNIVLLNALRPFLKEKRLAKVDRAIQIARLARVGSTAYRLLKEQGGGADV